MQIGSHEHFGILLNPAVHISFVETPEVKVEDIDYIELESKLSTQEVIDLDEDGIDDLREKLAGMNDGVHIISDFQYMHGEEDLEIYGKVKLNSDGSIDWHELFAVTESNNTLPVTFNKEEYHN